MSEGSVFFMLAGAVAGTAEPSRQEEREGSEEEHPDQLSKALAGSMVSQSHYWGRDCICLYTVYSAADP